LKQKEQNYKNSVFGKSCDIIYVTTFLFDLNLKEVYYNYINYKCKLLKRKVGKYETKNKN